MPTQSDGVFITEQEKREAIERGTRELREWRERNADAPRGLPVRR
jgi:hypothetical protein